MSAGSYNIVIHKILILTPSVPSQPKRVVLSMVMEVINPDLFDGHNTVRNLAWVKLAFTILLS